MSRLYKSDNDYKSLKNHESSSDFGITSGNTLSRQKTFEEDGVQLVEDTQWIGWDQQSGSDVQGFIKRKLESAVMDFEFNQQDQLLSGKNAFGDVVCQTRVVNAEPHYDYELIPYGYSLSANGAVVPFTNQNKVIVEYNENLEVYFHYQVFTKVEVGGQESYTSQTRDIRIFYTDEYDRDTLGNNYYRVQVTDRQPSLSKGSTNYIKTNVTELFSKGQFSGQHITIQLTGLANESGTLSAEIPCSFDLRQITLIPPTSIFGSTGSFTYDIDGLTDTTNLQLQYYDYYKNVASGLKTIPLTSTGEVTISGLDYGAHYIVARVASTGGSGAASPWVRSAFLVQQQSNNMESIANAVIADIPETLDNCSTNKIFKVQTTNKISGNVVIKVYSADTQEAVNRETSLSNTLNYTFTANDSEQHEEKFMYIEMSGASSKYFRFTVTTDDGLTLIVPQWVISGRASAQKFFQIEVVNPTENKNGELNYVTSGLSTHLSQLNKCDKTGDLLDPSILNPELSASDGWVTDVVRQYGSTVDNSYQAFKVSPTDGGLYGENKSYLLKTKTGQNLVTSSSKNFSVELLLRSEGVSDLDDEIMRIGKSSNGGLKFCPGHLVLDVNDFDPNYEKYSIYTSSRADYERENVTHVTITYEEGYIPKTYNELYNTILDGEYYSGSGANIQYKAQGYNLLKIYVNGVVNRELQLKQGISAIAEGNDSVGWRLPVVVDPKHSILYLYTFKTYSKALSPLEVQQNYIASKLYQNEKIDIYNRNDIISKSTGRISVSRCLAKNYPVLVAVHDKTQTESNQNMPLNWNNQDQSCKATILLRYNDPNKNKYNGRLYGGKLKPQGSSARRYLIHNLGYKSFYWVPEYLENGELNPNFDKNDKSTDKAYYLMPPYETLQGYVNNDDIKIESLVGKVNYASSMQSHKQGAIKLYNDAYNFNIGDAVYQVNDLNKLTGGRKAVLEEEFLYFWIEVDPEIKDTITWDYITQHDDDCYFIGFNTFGSAKKDKQSSGYNKKSTPEYILIEGADNANPAANFKTPWAALQKWKDLEFDDNGYVTSESEALLSNFDESVEQQRTFVETSESFTKGLALYDETIRYKSGSADAWDADFGHEAYTTLDTKGQEAESKFYKFTKNVESSTLPLWAMFCNLMYLFDFSSYKIATLSEINGSDNCFDITNDNDIQFKLIMPETAALYNKDVDTKKIAAQGNVLRWDSEKNIWVNAGLHYDNGDWVVLNIRDLWTALYALNRKAHGNTVTSQVETVLANCKFGSKVEDAIKHLLIAYPECFEKSSVDGSYKLDDYPGTVAQIIENNNGQDYIYFRLMLAELFKAACKEYLDVNDIAYHQAFIRLVSGTDNRAKNTYFQIIGQTKSEVDTTVNHDYNVVVQEDDLVDGKDIEIKDSKGNVIGTLTIKEV